MKERLGIILMISIVPYIVGAIASNMVEIFNRARIWQWLLGMWILLAFGTLIFVILLISGFIVKDNPNYYISKLFEP